MRVFIAGDTHGNTNWWLSYLLPTAKAHRADVIVQVGDFGFWEHEPDGITYLDRLNREAAAQCIVIYALHGNHDNWSDTMRRYGHDRDDDGFVRVRSHIRYIPQGHVWTWAGRSMRAFGGAYSLDKEWRIKTERKREAAAWSRENERRAAGKAPRDVPSFADTLWFRDEEMTDQEFTELMVAHIFTVDVVFSHDKPRGSDPGLDLKNEPACHPNQDRLQLALHTHRPRFWFHGHLHHAYTQTLRSGDDDTFTDVIGLSCDDAARPRFWRPYDCWAVLDLLDDERMVVTTGRLLEELKAEVTPGLPADDGLRTITLAIMRAKRGTPHEEHDGWDLPADGLPTCGCGEELPGVLKAILDGPLR